MEMTLYQKSLTCVLHDGREGMSLFIQPRWPFVLNQVAGIRIPVHLVDSVSKHTRPLIHGIDLLLILLVRGLSSPLNEEAIRLSQTFTEKILQLQSQLIEEGFYPLSVW